MSTKDANKTEVTETVQENTGAAQETPATETVATENLPVVTTEGAVVKSTVGTAYITKLLTAIKEEFVEANADLDMDFVFMGTWLTIDKKGNFVEKDDETVKYGDSIDVVFGQGEKRWSVWGLKDSPEDGTLIVACKEKPEAEAQMTAWLEANPEAQSRYTLDSLELRYMAFVVPVSTLNPEDFPKVYLMSFSPTATLDYGKYAMAVFGGRYKLMGVKARTGINKVVTRLTTAEKTGKKFDWIGIDFTAVGMFSPADYGIVETEEPTAAAAE